MNSDEVPAQSATDDVESDDSVWSPESNPGPPLARSWERIAISGVDHRWHGPDAGSMSDVHLVSPPLPVGGAGSFGFSFQHRHVFDAADCAPGDGTLWSAPSEILDLEASGGATTSFTWPAPAQPGGSAPVTYDLLRSDGATFGGATCQEAGTGSTSSIDSEVPAGLFYYLLGTRNGCGRTIAPDSDGNTRTAPSCTP